MSKARNSLGQFKKIEEKEPENRAEFLNKASLLNAIVLLLIVIGISPWLFFIIKNGIVKSAYESIVQFYKTNFLCGNCECKAPSPSKGKNGIF